MKKQKNSKCPGIPKPKRWYKKTPEILLDDEIDLLLQEAMKHGHRDYTLILFALSTGLRNSEVVGLNIGNVYPFGTTVSILDLPAEIAKGKKPRKIPLNDNIRAILEFYIIDEFNSKRITGGESPLFRSKYTNKRLGQRDFQQILRRHAIASIQQPCKPHKLRHTFATKLLEQSNIKIVQEILGHTCLQSTQIYLHPSSSDKMTAVNKLKFGTNQKK
ncbi:MAG: tyrosine-type recombinase/integrase [Candidatus Helarchaeota archaeon]|nr:tyrosine-type recombinase/integrase [Candidatus Helarchaeota archaeon]